MSKIKMRSPDDGKVYEFDSQHAREALKKGWLQELGVGQQATRWAADALPTIASMAGAGAGLAAGAPTLGTASIPGAMLGGAAGAGMGAIGQRALYNTAGILTNDDPMAMLGNVAGNAATGMLGGAFQGMGANAPSMAPGVMKAGLGNAQPGVENTLVKEGLEVSEGGLKKANALMKQLKAQKAAVIESSPESYSWKHMGQAVSGARSAARTGDVVSQADAKALTAALNNVKRMLGPQTKGGGLSELYDEFGNQIVRESKTTPALRLDLKRLEAIRRWSDGKVKLYEQMRKGQSVTDPGPLEKAYLAVGDKARSLINTIPAGNGQTLGAVNARISALSDAEKAIFGALKRSPGRHAVAVAGGAAAGVPSALYTHNPAYLLAGLPGAAAGHVATDPRSLSQIALMLNNPNVGVAAGLAPRIPEALLRLLGVGSPQAQPGVPE